MYTTFIFDPIFNLFLWLIQTSAFSIGLAIVFLTIAVRLALYIPMHRSMMHSKSMQELQPKIQEVRNKYKDDQQELAKKTMALYKEHGVNPFSSCLPIILQIPILLAVFGVLRLDFTDPTILSHAYETFKGFDLAAMNLDFLGFDMTKTISEGVNEGMPYYIVLPILVGVSQYISLKLAMKRTHKKVTDVTSESEETDQMKQTNSPLFHITSPN